ncbi:MAG: cupin domain-containing protein [Candidatus Acidiferrum sp.]
MTVSDLHQVHEPSEWAVLYTFGELTADEKESFEEHLDSGCPECKTEVGATGNLAAKLAGEVAKVPPVALRARLLKQTTAGESKTAREGILLDRAGLLIARTAELPWEAAPIPGIKSKAIYVDAARKYSTSLVRVEPGAVYPSHWHADIEEVFLLEGDFLIEGVKMAPGDYCRSEPGTVHGASTTLAGALLLVVSSQQDRVMA